MKKYLNLFVALVAMLFAGSSFAYTPPPAPQNGWYVSDQTGKLTQEQITSLNQKIEQVSKTTKNEFGILFLNTMDGDNIEDVAYTTFNTWGIGKRGLDNGCLIVVSLTERKSRIETGKGVGGEVTDVQALNILKTSLNPHLKTGDFAGGFHATLDALSALIESRHNQKALVVTEPTSTSVSSGCSLVAGVGAGSEDVSSLPFLVLLLGVSGIVVVMLVRRNARRKQKAIDDAAEDAELEYCDDGCRGQRVTREAKDLADRQARLAKEEEELVARRANNLRIENERKERQARLERERTPATVRAPYDSTMLPPRSTVPPVPRPKTKTVVKAAAVVAGGVTAGALAAAAEKRLKDREEEDRLARKRRADQDDEDRRRRQRDDDDRRSSSSSDYGFGSSSGSDYSSGGGFDGGSSGGGGGSSDW